MTRYTITSCNYNEIIFEPFYDFELWMEEWLLKEYCVDSATVFFGDTEI